MVDTDDRIDVRLVGFVYGLISTAGGIAVFVLFVRVPADLLYLPPPALARLVLDVAPWLVATGRASVTGFLGMLLMSVVFVGFGLGSLGFALFGSFLPVGVGGGGGDGGD